jgi:hypothetical protein
LGMGNGGRSKTSRQPTPNSRLAYPGTGATRAAQAGRLAPQRQRRRAGDQSKVETGLARKAPASARHSGEGAVPEGTGEVSKWEGLRAAQRAAGDAVADGRRRWLQTWPNAVPAALAGGTWVHGVEEAAIGWREGGNLGWPAKNGQLGANKSAEVGWPGTPWE